MFTRGDKTGIYPYGCSYMFSLHKKKQHFAEVFEDGKQFEGGWGGGVEGARVS